MEGRLNNLTQTELLVSVRLSFSKASWATTGNALLPKMEAGITVQGEACMSSHEGIISKNDLAISQFFTRNRSW